MHLIMTVELRLCSYRQLQIIASSGIYVQTYTKTMQ